jgi:Mitochondrial branched-chain alpha-ketoacid dehydrogenase kinase
MSCTHDMCIRANCAPLNYTAPSTQAEEEQYGNTLASILLDHTQVPQALSRGVLELKASGALTPVDQHRVDKILDNFFTSRYVVVLLLNYSSTVQYSQHTLHAHT